MRVAAQLADLAGGHGFELIVGNGQNDAIVTGHLGFFDGLDAVFPVGLVRVDPGVVDVNGDVVVLQLADHVDHPGVAQVRAVFLEGQAHYQYPGAVDLDAAVKHGLDQLAGHETAHAVVDTPPREDHFRVVTHRLGFMGQVVRVHADAVTAHQAWAERQEVPLRAGGFKYFLGVDVHALEDHRQFVDQGDIKVSLGVFDHLGGFRYLNAGGPVGAGGDHGGIETVHGVRHFRGGAGGDLHDVGDAVELIARVNALRAVAGVEVLVEGEAGDPLQHRHAVLLGGAGEYRGLVNHDIAGLEGLADGLGRPDQRRQVGLAVLVDGGGHGDDVDVTAVQGRRIVAERQALRGGQLRVAELPGKIVPFAQIADTVAVNVKAHHRAVLAELRGQWQAHIAQADHGQFDIVQRRVTHSLSTLLIRPTGM